MMTLKNKFEASKWSQFEYEKTTFRALKRAIKFALLLILCCYYTDRVRKTRRGLVLQIGLPLLTLLMGHKLCFSLLQCSRWNSSTTLMTHNQASKRDRSDKPRGIEGDRDGKFRAIEG
jgi:hypothetical protein